MEKIFEAIAKYLEQFKQDVVSDVVRAILAQSAKTENAINCETTWLSPQQTRELIRLKSRNSLKKLRESGEIHFVKIGREFQYDRASLLDYIDRKSTKRYTLKNSNAKPKAGRQMIRGE